MTHWAVEMLFGTALLAGLVLLIRRPFARLFGARAAYALWLAPLARLLLPPLPGRPEVPTNWIDAGQGVAVDYASAASSLADQALVLWVAGAILFGVWHLARYRLFLRAALTGARPYSAGTPLGVTILASPAVGGPAATGLLARRIFVPVDFDAIFSAEERRWALAHEALHHRRHDLSASAIALLLLALHWWNPLAYLAHRAFRRDLETACDAELLAAADGPTRQSYATMLVRCVAQPWPRPICALTHIDDLKGRLQMLKLRHGALRRRTGEIIAVATAAAGLSCSLPALAQENESPSSVPAANDGDVGNKVVIRLKGQRDIVGTETGGKPCAGQTFEVDIKSTTGKPSKPLTLCTVQANEAKDPRS